MPCLATSHAAPSCYKARGPEMRPRPPRMAFLWAVACLALASAVSGKQSHASREVAPYRAGAVACVPLLPQAQHPRCQQVFGVREARGSGDGSAEQGCSPWAQALSGVLCLATLVPLSISRRLRGARDQPLVAVQREDHQRAECGVWLLALAGVPAGVSPSCSHRAGRWARDVGGHPRGRPHPLPVPSLRHSRRAQPQLFSPFSSPDPNRIPLLRRLPDQQLLGGHGCPLRIQVRSDALWHPPAPAPCRGTPAEGRAQPQDAPGITGQPQNPAPKGPSSPRLPPQLAPWHHCKPRGCGALGPGAGCHRAP